MRRPSPASTQDVRINNRLKGPPLSIKKRFIELEDDEYGPGGQAKKGRGGGATPPVPCVRDTSATMLAARPPPLLGLSVAPLASCLPLSGRGRGSRGAGVKRKAPPGAEAEPPRGGGRRTGWTDYKTQPQLSVLLDLLCRADADAWAAAVGITPADAERGLELAPWLRLETAATCETLDRCRFRTLDDLLDSVRGLCATAAAAATAPPPARRAHRLQQPSDSSAEDAPSEPQSFSFPPVGPSSTTPLHPLLHAVSQPGDLEFAPVSARSEADWFAETVTAVLRSAEALLACGKPAGLKPVPLEMATNAEPYFQSDWRTVPFSRRPYARLRDYTARRPTPPHRPSLHTLPRSPRSLPPRQWLFESTTTRSSTQPAHLSAAPALWRCGATHKHRTLRVRDLRDDCFLHPPLQVIADGLDDELPEVAAKMRTEKHKALGGCSGACCGLRSDLGRFNVIESRFRGRCACLNAGLECSELCGCAAAATGGCLNSAAGRRRTLLVGVHVRERDVWGLDSFTRVNVHDAIRASGLLDGAPEGAMVAFTERVLLPALNRLGDGGWDLVRACEGAYEQAQAAGDAWSAAAAVAVAARAGSVSRGYFRVHPKGCGVVCATEAGIPPQTFVEEYFGEVHPPWCGPYPHPYPPSPIPPCLPHHSRIASFSFTPTSLRRWFEKQDALKTRRGSELPDFYNITLERPKDDPAGFDMLFVDAAPAGSLASRLSHSCTPNCQAVIMAAAGRLTVAIFTLRWIAPGEELTFDYSSVTESDAEYRTAVCLCGARPRCFQLSFPSRGTSQSVRTGVTVCL